LPSGLYVPRATSVWEPPSGATSHNRAATCAAVPETASFASTVGAPRSIHPLEGGSVYTAVPGATSVFVVAQASPPPAAGSTAAPVCGSPELELMVCSAAAL